MRKKILSILLFLPLLSAAQTPLEKVAVENLLVDAVTMLDSDAPDKALSLLKALLKKDPSNDAVHYYMGLCNYSLGNPADALKDFETAAGLDPENRNYEEALASICLEQGQYDRGVDIFRSLMEKYPGFYHTPYILSVVADSELHSGRDSVARAYYQEALDYDPEYTPAIMGMTEIYRISGNMPAYFTTLDKMISSPLVQTGPKVRYLENLMKYVDASFWRRWNVQLDSLVTGVVKCAPTDSAALRFAGSWFYGTGRKEKGRAYFDEWLDAYPDDFSAREVRMELAATEGDVAETVRQCDTLLRMTGLNTAQKVRLFSILGDSHYSLGEPLKAFSYYEKALKLDPAYAPVLNNYAYYLSLRKEKLSKALRMSRMAVEVSPDNATYLDTYGWVLFLRNKPAEAKPLFKRAMLYGGKESKVVLMHYSAVLDALGEKDLSTYYKSLAEEKKDED